MAKKMKTWLTDDKEASAGREVDADQTVLFSLDGKEYEIDLCSKNATKIRSDIGQWVEHARVVGRQRRGPASRAINARPRPEGGTGDGMDTEQRKAAREWLRNNGWPQLGDRGRIPADAMDAYHAGAAVSA